MSWLDELRPATFRSVAFHVQSAEAKGGRSIVTHAVPGSNARPYKEDVGASEKSVSVEAFVFGDDYLQQLDALLKALDTPGPGQLSHPYLGLITVVVDGAYSVRQSGDEGGLAVVTIPFGETSEAPPAPSASSSSPTSALEAQVATARASAAQAFAVHASAQLADGITGIGFQAAAGLVTAVGRRMQAMLAALVVPGPLLARFNRLLDAPRVRAADFAATPAAYLPALITSLFGGLMEALRDVDASVAQPARRLLELYDAVVIPDDADEETTAVAPAVTRLVQRAALCAASLALTSQRFDTYEGALAARQQVLDAINRHTAEVADATYADFVDLRGAIARAVPAAEATLPRLSRYTPTASVPSLVLAHRLWGDVASEADMLARNGVANPAFVAGGRELEVLSRG